MNVPRQVRLTVQLVRDARVPRWKKAVLLIPFLYLLWPVNWMFAWVPVLGQIDDLGLWLLTMRLFQFLVDDDILSEYTGGERLAGQTTATERRGAAS
jgi:uncharacterized membrane protein YkvA (DUF1232 family)